MKNSTFVQKTFFPAHAQFTPTTGDVNLDKHLATVNELLSLSVDSINDLKRAMSRNNYSEEGITKSVNLDSEVLLPVLVKLSGVLNDGRKNILRENTSHPYLAKVSKILLSISSIIYILKEYGVRLDTQNNSNIDEVLSILAFNLEKLVASLISAKHISASNIKDINRFMMAMQSLHQVFLNCAAPRPCDDMEQ